MDPVAADAIKVFFLTAFASALAVLWTPALTDFLYRHKLWRKSARTKSIDGRNVEIFNKFHSKKEVSVPRFGGLLIWATTLFVALIFWIISMIFSGFPSENLDFNFLSREETWLPMFALVIAAIVGLWDDITQIKGKGKYIAGGLTFWQRFVTVFIIGLIAGLWFSVKLGADAIHIPGNGDFVIGGFLFAAFTVIVMLACWSGGVIDGLDGLAGGSFASMFVAFGIIAFADGQTNLAAFCGVIAGTILSFLWFNIPPARFYMGETGSLALTSTLAVVAFLTDSVLVLPIIGGLLVIESGSVIIQLLSKKFLGKKIFMSTPIHHHFQAKGWPEAKIVMRFWIIGIVFAIVGVAIRLLG